MAGPRLPGPIAGTSPSLDKGTLARAGTGAPGPVVAGKQKKPHDPCAQAKADIPMSPLWHMAWASRGNKDNFDVLQKAIDYLTCKAKNKQNFDDREKEFLKEIFEALWWGGKYKGLSEAAELANHYVNGDGRRLQIKSEVYETSVIVKDTMAVLKQYISEEVAAKRNVVTIKTGNAALNSKPYYRALTQSGGARNFKTQGYILKNGALLTEQNNQRLKNADNRFYLQVTVLNAGSSSVRVKWSVESVYDFEPFEKQDYYTNIPLADGMVLKLPDGLSHYLVTLGVAKDFQYFAEWQESW